ncbi:MAG: DNA polymerase III subunit epsilon [Rhodocyclaceae bacterium]|nr:MAG: DNA polymerase III subunit epsilon [Rhodocyclaceae bacterium]TND03349.1 MAG: DNA polymerase III subunit epsilon [Rhodocyclaceae bacterium]
MSSPAKLIVAAVVACIYLLVVLLAAGVVLGSGLEGEEQALFSAVLEHRLGAVVMIALVACVFLFLMLRAAHEFLVLLPARAAEEAGAMLEEPATRLTLRGSGELRALIVAVNRLAEQRHARDEDIEARIRAANAAAEADRNRFAVLMSELAQGVIVCNPDGRVLLYNRRARALFAGSAGQGMAALGLGRSIYGVFDRHLIAYALENIDVRRRNHRHFVTATESGRLLRVLVAPIPEAGAKAVDAAEAGAAHGISGYMTMIEDMTETFDSESTRDQMLQELTESSRGPVGNLRAAAETLHDYADMSVEDHQRFLGVVRDEAEGLADRIEAAARKYAAVLKARWPLEEMLGSDLVTAARQRIADRHPVQVSLEDVDPEVWIKVDGFSLLQAMTYLAARLHDEYQIRDLKLRLTRDGEMAQIDLIWSGVFMSTETVMTWELDPMTVAGESSPLTVRDVVERNGAEVWFQRDHAAYRAFFRFLLPAISGQVEAASSAIAAMVDSRPEFYDFDLFKAEETGLALDDRLLAQLSYTVFDTETTGLEPSAGDEIIQIGAVRIVNRRLLSHEAYEQLIDPLRSLPAQSVKIHGITAEMLDGRPPIAQVLPVFRAFVADTVLVAHNAAFDMRFLELKEASTGIRFDRPVLDTFLLSAVLFPNQETHRLEAIAERLGVSVLGRHTAVGDAIVTAEVFLKMLPLLADKGIRTLGQAREASEKTYHARIRY